MTIGGKTVNTRVIGFFIVFYLFAFITYWLKPWGTANQLLENLVYLTAPLLAVIAAAYLALTYGITRSKSLMFFSLTTGLLFLFLGEALYVYFDFVLKERPFPTIADIFYLMSYPFVLLAIFSESRFMHNTLEKANLRSGAIYGVIFLMLAAVVFWFGIVKAYSVEEPILNNIISTSYGAGDLLIISGAMYLLFLAGNIRLSAETYLWTGIVAGFGCITAADILFAEFNEVYLSGNFLAKNIMDSFWMLGYTTIAFFLMNFASTTLSAKMGYLKK